MTKGIEQPDLAAGQEPTAPRRLWVAPKVIVSMIREVTASTFKGFVSAEHHDTSSTILS